MPPDVPLPTLLSQALVAFTIEFDNAAEARSAAPGRRPWMVSQATWANYLRFIGDDGLPAHELRWRALVPERVIRSRLGAFRRWRYVTVGPDHVVRLTAGGQRARAVWEPLAGEIEGRWRERFGEHDVARLRDALEHALRDPGPELPLHLPIVGYGLGSEVVPAPDQARADPPGGHDLSVLLARTLLRFTLEFEAGAPLSLPMGADGLRVLGEEPVRVRDLPAMTGGSKEAMAMVVGFLERAGLAAVAPDPQAGRGKVVRLTARGLAAQAAHARRLASVQERWRDRLGAPALAALADALDTILAAPAFAQGLEPPSCCWGGRTPQATATARLLADPRAALPHHPLMLHRGGFPDGS